MKTRCIWKSKRIVSLFLSLAMVLTALPLTALSALAATSGDFKYAVLSETDKTCEITDYTGSATKLAIPSDLDGYTVTSIGSSAFWNFTVLTSITIPGTVSNIGDCAFEHCTALASVTFSNSVTSIGDSAFEDCTALASVTFSNSVTSIG
ncbi:MAG: leucine-rich repeat domain-containing protein, partial [Candidatus Fimenecus sp.]